MNLFLLELSQTYKDDKLTLVLDGAGWHKSKKLIIPANIHIIHLPPYSPELNPYFYPQIKKSCKVVNACIQ